jgi:hypothetical protein
MRHRRARHNSSFAPQLDRVFEAVNLRVEAGDPRPDLRMLRDAMAFELSDVIGSKYAKAGASDSRPEAYLRGLLSAGEGMIAPPPAPTPAAPPPAPRTRRPRRRRGESVAGAIMGVVEGEHEKKEAERQRVAAWKLETPIYEPLEDLLAPWKPWARSQLARVRKGADPELRGWGMVNGVEYVTNGYWLMPGYKGPKDEIEFKQLNPRSFRFAGDMTAQVKSVMETRGLREIFVSFVPEKKDIQSAYHWPEAIHTTAGAEMQINPRYLAMAVYAVGPNAILLQESDPHGKILVRGDKGDAIIMPMRATL